MVTNPNVVLILINLDASLYTLPMIVLRSPCLFLVLVVVCVLCSNVSAQCPTQYENPSSVAPSIINCPTTYTSFIPTAIDFAAPSCVNSTVLRQNGWTIAVDLYRTTTLLLSDLAFVRRYENSAYQSSGTASLTSKGLWIAVPRVLRNGSVVSSGMVNCSILVSSSIALTVAPNDGLIRKGTVVFITLNAPIGLPCKTAVSITGVFDHYETSHTFSLQLLVEGLNILSLGVSCVFNYQETTWTLISNTLTTYTVVAASVAPLISPLDSLLKYGNITVTFPMPTTVDANWGTNDIFYALIPVDRAYDHLNRPLLPAVPLENFTKLTTEKLFVDSTMIIQAYAVQDHNAPSVLVSKRIQFREPVERYKYEIAEYCLGSVFAAYAIYTLLVISSPKTFRLVVLDYVFAFGPALMDVADVLTDIMFIIDCIVPFQPGIVSSSYLYAQSAVAFVGVATIAWRAQWASGFFSDVSLQRHFFPAISVAEIAQAHTDDLLLTEAKREYWWGVQRLFHDIPAFTVAVLFTKNWPRLTTHWSLAKIFISIGNIVLGIKGLFFGFSRLLGDLSGLGGGSDNKEDEEDRFGENAKSHRTRQREEKEAREQQAQEQRALEQQRKNPMNDLRAGTPTTEPFGALHSPNGELIIVEGGGGGPSTWDDVVCSTEAQFLQHMKSVKQESSARRPAISRSVLPQSRALQYADSMGGDLPYRSAAFNVALQELNVSEEDFCAGDDTKLPQVASGKDARQLQQAPPPPSVPSGNSEGGGAPHNAADPSTDARDSPPRRMSLAQHLAQPPQRRVPSPQQHAATNSLPVVSRF